ncbi:MAG TPA: hypothetical protein VFD86_04445 [Nitrospira sp.]|nr:hypothetical protein [Nitrospira sp.]
MANLREGGRIVILFNYQVNSWFSQHQYKKAALPVMVEARPCGAKATGQLWKGQDQNLVGHWTVAWAVEWPVVGSSPYVGC